MTTPTHRERAERLLADATSYGEVNPYRADMLRRATIHALLALSEPVPSYDIQVSAGVGEDGLTDEERQSMAAQYHEEVVAAPIPTAAKKAAARKRAAKKTTSPSNSKGTPK